MKKLTKNSLPKKVSERVARNLKLSKIKLGFPKKVIWLVITIFTFLTFGGYYPTLSIPPIKRSQVYAQTNEQKEEIIPSSFFSKAVNLPHPGYLSSRFSSWHPGIDIATGLGMPIHPIIEGEIVEVGRDFFGLGNYVTVLHENNFKSKYAHMGRIYVRVGQKLSTENTLGEVGLTGFTSGPHTHLEITQNEKYIDPQKMLPKIPNMPASPPSGVASRGEPKVQYYVKK